jgi:lysophospholipase L1-like esterase
MSRDKLEALYIRDRIHLNAEGHRLFAESTGPALQAWIGRRAER